MNFHDPNQSKHITQTHSNYAPELNIQIKYKNILF